MSRALVDENRAFALDAEAMMSGATVQEVLEAAGEYTTPLLRLSQKAADRLTAASNGIFAVALLPTVIADAPPTPLTSAATIVALGMLQAVLLHFRLWWGCFWNVVCASMWVILLIQGLSG